MKKFIFLAAAVCALAVMPSAGRASASSLPECDGKSACLMEANSGEIVYNKNESQRLPIASVCKVMTLNLVFEAIEDGRLSAEGSIRVSDRAAGMGGSQVFLESGGEYPVGSLIRSVVVCSANDSCVALAEAVGGSEEGFVDMMNDRAAEWGCADTLFANCTGLPKQTQYSCAKDVAVMFCHLITHEQYFEHSKVWLEDFAHPGGRVTSMTNTNKLIRKYSACDGGKTGFTNEAGFCLAATAEKDNLRFVSVVLGGTTSQKRFDDVAALFDYGFANYVNMIVLDGTVNLNERLPVGGGKKEYVCVRPERDCLVFCERGSDPDITFFVDLPARRAPFDKGSRVGCVEVYRDGLLVDSVPLVSAERAERAGFGDSWRKIAENWGV